MSTQQAPEPADETSRIHTFPYDWKEWRREWCEWIAERPEMVTIAGTMFPRNKNLMADDILGYFKVGGVNVELSEVTFCERRGIGITFAQDGKRWTPENGVVHSFSELEEELGLRERKGEAKTESGRA